MEWVIGHILLSLIVSTITLLKTDQIQETFIVLIVVGLLPVVGFTLLVFYTLFLGGSSINPEDLSEDSHCSSTPKRTIHDVDIEKELNVLPLNDVLNISDNRVKREKFLTAIQGDIGDVGKYISDALHNKDSETSHYAAALIQGTKNKLEIKVQEFHKLYEINPDNSELVKEYCDFLISVLKSNLMDEVAHKMVQEEYIEFSNKLIYWNINEEKYITTLIKIYLEFEDKKMLRKYIDLYYDKYPDTILKYMTCLEVDFKMKDKESFKNMLTEVRNTNFSFDGKTLSIVRFWLNG